MYCLPGTIFDVDTETYFIESIAKSFAATYPLSTQVKIRKNNVLPDFPTITKSACLPHRWNESIDFEKFTPEDKNFAKNISDTSINCFLQIPKNYANHEDVLIFGNTVLSTENYDGNKQWGVWRKHIGDAYHKEEDIFSPREAKSGYKTAKFLLRTCTRKNLDFYIFCYTYGFHAAIPIVDLFKMCNFYAGWDGKSCPIISEIGCTRSYQEKPKFYSYSRPFKEPILHPLFWIFPTHSKENLLRFWNHHSTTTFMGKGTRAIDVIQMYNYSTDLSKHSRVKMIQYVKKTSQMIDIIERIHEPHALACCDVFWSAYKPKSWDDLINKANAFYVN